MYVNTKYTYIFIILLSDIFWLIKSYYEDHNIFVKNVDYKRKCYSIFFEELHLFTSIYYSLNYHIYYRL